MNIGNAQQLVLVLRTWECARTGTSECRPINRVTVTLAPFLNINTITQVTVPGIESLVNESDKFQSDGQGVRESDNASSLSSPSDVAHQKGTMMQMLIISMSNRMLFDMFSSETFYLLNYRFVVGGNHPEK